MTDAELFEHIDKAVDEWDKIRESWRTKYAVIDTSTHLVGEVVEVIPSPELL